MVKVASVQEAIVSRLCVSMIVEYVLGQHVGPKYKTTKVTFGGTGIFVSVINCTSYLAEYKANKGILVDFKELGLSLPQANSSFPVTLADIGTVLLTKADSRKNTRLAKEYDCQPSHCIGGNVDFVKGTLTSITLSLPVTAHVTANKD